MSAATFDLQAIRKMLANDVPRVDIGRFDGRKLGVSRFSSHPKWEMHPNGDEFLYAIDGMLNLTLLYETHREEFMLETGSGVVIPKGVWHSPVPNGSVTLLHLAEYEATQVSNLEDPLTKS
jgi:mannose-6-phosphate isomerase-like protein (cupin superfamily)